MKTITYGLLMAATLFFSAGCEKDSLTSGKKKPAISSTEKAIPNINVTASSNCGGRVCGAIEIGATSMSNMLIIQNQSGGGLPSLRYSIYERVYFGGGVEVYQPVTQYTCSETTTYYAGGLLNNGAKILVIATDPAYPAPPAGNQVLIGGVLTPAVGNSTYTTVTLGNFKGVSCGGPPMG